MKDYNCREKPPNFNPRDLYPGLDNKGVAESLADHFNVISREFHGLDPNYDPGGFGYTLPVLTLDQVATRL